MNNKFLVGAGLSMAALAMMAKDPVIMTVNGVDVPKSEFEYLYHKNSQQQLSPQTLQEYVEMFKIYKLKVADAKAAGIDTTASFRKEMAQYRRELAQPYITDSLFLYKLVEEAAERGKEEVETSHIMLAKLRTDAENRVLKARLDSIRNEILSGKDFAEMASQFSTDKGTASRGGYMGYITANRYPYTFEMAAYTTPEGEVSEVIESPFGYHLVKTGKHRPAKGKVHASHIMKLARKNATPEERARAKASIDSIYNVVKANPSRFADIARSESDDRGSAMNGGELPWFGPGEMVPEFENMAFALSDGEISAPIETTYGWHIILKQGSKGAPEADEIRDDLLKRFMTQQDGRYAVIKKHNSDWLAEKHNLRIVEPTVEALKAAAKNGIDSLFFEKCEMKPLSDLSIFEIGKKKVPLSEYIATIKTVKAPDGETAVAIIDNTLENFKANRLNKEEEDWLYANNADYRNLLNEYHDGSLLYEVSVEKVWDKAAKDKEGLERYFNSHRDNYSWTQPHAKGILVQAVNDSVAQLVRDRMDSLPADSIMTVIRKEFKGKATAERVLARQGENAIVDNVLFGGPAAKPAKGYSVYFIYNPRILTVPEEVNDIRGAVTGDYQTDLETEWVEELKSKYPITVNEKELRKVK